MEIAWQKVRPVLTSLVIIIRIAILKEYSRTVAAIAATIPLKVPLALWIIDAAEEGEQAAMVDFSGSMLLTIGPTVLFVAVSWLLLRAGWDLLPVIGGGYVAWALALGTIFLTRHLLGV